MADEILKYAFAYFCFGAATFLLAFTVWIVNDAKLLVRRSR